MPTNGSVVSEMQSLLSPIIYAIDVSLPEFPIGEVESDKLWKDILRIQNNSKYITCVDVVLKYRRFKFVQLSE